jgi:hypothetical protein
MFQVVSYRGLGEKIAMILQYGSFCDRESVQICAEKGYRKEMELKACLREHLGVKGRGSIDADAAKLNPSLVRHHPKKRVL